MIIVRSRKLVDSFVDSMFDSIKYFSAGRIPESEIRCMAEKEVNRMDFNNEWQMHKGVGYFAKMAVERYFSAE